MKKAQLLSQPMNFLFALVILGSIMIVGYKSIEFLTEKNCKSKLITMNIDLSEATKLQSSLIGSWKDKTYNLCDLDKLYLVDTSKDVSFSEFKDFPQIVNAIKDKVKKNTFLVEQKEVETELYVPYLDLSSPYFLCLKPRDNKIELTLEGKGAGTRIYPKSGLYDCTFNSTPIELTSKDLKELISDIQEEVNLGGNVIIDANDACLKRKFEESNRSDSTKITITKCKGTFRYIEQIPKCVIQELNKAIQQGKIIFSEPPSILETDPVIMWEFTEAAEEERYYEIKKMIEEKCKSDFKGVGVKGKDKDAKVDVVPDKKITPVPVSLIRALEFDRHHGSLDDDDDHNGGNDITKKVKALDDDIEDIDVNKLLHIEFDEQVRHNGIITVYAKCEPSGLLILKSEGYPIPLGSAPCDVEFKMMNIKIVSPSFSGSVFDITTELPTREVEYDFVDIEKE